jgi:hypothetical protein
MATFWIFEPNHPLQQTGHAIDCLLGPERHTRVSRLLSLVVYIARLDHA